MKMIVPALFIVVAMAPSASLALSVQLPAVPRLDMNSLRSAIQTRLETIPSAGSSGTTSASASSVTIFRSDSGGTSSVSITVQTSADGQTHTESVSTSAPAAGSFSFFVATSSSSGTATASTGVRVLTSTTTAKEGRLLASPAAPSAAPSVLEGAFNAPLFVQGTAASSPGESLWSQVNQLFGIFTHSLQTGFLW